jgi:hypothetical protein
MRIGKFELMKLLMIDEHRLKWYMQKGLLPLSKKFELSDAIKLHVEYEVEYHGNKLKAKHEHDLLKLEEELTNKFASKRSKVQHESFGDARDRKDEADANIAEAKLEKILLENELARGATIRADEVDKAMSELQTQLVTNYKNDLRLLPIDLENLNRNDISKRLDAHYDKRIKDLNSFANTSTDNDLAFYDVMQLVMKLLIENNGNVDDLIGKLND